MGMWINGMLEYRMELDGVSFVDFTPTDMLEWLVDTPQEFHHQGLVLQVIIMLYMHF